MSVSPLKKKPTIIKAPILTIPNSFLRAQYKLSLTSQKLFYYTLFKYLKEDPKDFTVEFDYTEFFKDLDHSDGSKSREMVFKCAQEVQDLKVSVPIDNGDVRTYSLFSYNDCKFSSKKLAFKFNSDLSDFLDSLRNEGFSKINLKQLGDLKSVYSFRLFLIAISFKGFMGRNGNKDGCWFFDYSVDELKKLFVLDDDYPTKEITRLVISNPLREINSKDLPFNINYTAKRSGKFISGYHFDCELKDSLPAGEDDASNDKTELELSVLKQKYSGKYIELLSAELAKKNLKTSPEERAEAKLLKYVDELNREPDVDELKSRYPEKYVEFLLQESKVTDSSRALLSFERRAEIALAEWYKNSGHL